jgi:hypothetical protein
MQRCAALPATRYQTGLLFNPDGFQTYYDRARCFQELAVTSRDPALCARVAERRSWFLDGSGVSAAACRTRVARQRRADMAAAQELRAPQQLRQIRMERDNNGRDFNARVRTSGGDGASLRLTLVIVDPSGRERVLHTASAPMTDQSEELSIFVPADLLARTSGPDSTRPVLLRAYLERVLSGEDDRAVHAHALGLKLRSSAETVFVPAALKRIPG